MPTSPPRPAPRSAPRSAGPLPPGRLARGPLAVLLAAAVAAPAAFAQGPAPPTILVDVPGGARLLEDFNALLDLAGSPGASQKRGLNDILEGLLVGVDRDAPVRVEPLTDASPTRYRVIVPVSDRADFEQQNLQVSGIRVNRVSGQSALRRLGGVKNAAFDGYMKYYPAGGKDYAVIVERTADLPDALAPPGQLLRGSDDAIFYLVNAAGSPDDVAARWARVEEARAEAENALRPLEGETKEEFALRKTAAGGQVRELGRYYAEARQVFVRGNLPPSAAGAITGAIFQPLPGTESADAVARAAAEPSRFAGVPFDEDAAFCGRTRFPLTPRQVTGLKEVTAKMRAWADSKVAADADAPPARGESWRLLFDLFEQSVATGEVDAYARVDEVGEERRIVGGFALAPDADAVPAVRAFVNARGGRALEAGIGEVGGVTLHRVSFDAGRAGKVAELLGGSEMLVGTAPGVFWYAAGPDARASLEAAIVAAQAPGEADPQFFRFTARPAPALDLLRTISLSPKGEDLFGPYRPIADEVLAACDGRIKAVLAKREDGTVRATASMPRCLLELMGRVIAEYSRRNKLAG